jgi:CDGSH-type Zn-finger protein
MRVWLTFAVALGTIAVPVGAERAQRDESKPAKSEQRPLVLASADAVHASSTPARESASSPTKPVTPRVTTCRCGDSDATPESDGQ